MTQSSPFYFNAWRCAGSFCLTLIGRTLLAIVLAFNHPMVLNGMTRVSADKPVVVGDMVFQGPGQQPQTAHEQLSHELRTQQGNQEQEDISSITASCVVCFDGLLGLHRPGHECIALPMHTLVCHCSRNRRVLLFAKSVKSKLGMGSLKDPLSPHVPSLAHDLSLDYQRHSRPFSSVCTT